jgi:hypothetical protein
MGGTMYFDDGGVVPDGDGDDSDGGSDGDQDDGSVNPTGDAGSMPSVDPMSVIQQALQYGRQSMGLPPNLTQGPQQMAANMPTKPGTQSDSGVVPTPPTPGALGQQQTASFDDGGVVPDPSQQNQTPTTQGTGASLPDPRKTMQYLTGGGGVQPEIADAMEKLVDPQGQMDPSERTLATIMASPSPNAQFGLMQHYRSRANAYSGAARAALDQGNMAQAAAHATSMFANTPTGMKVKFAPAHGGIAMSAQKANVQQGAQQGQQSFDAGGDVDMDNPSVIQGQGGKEGGLGMAMADGGEVPEYEGADDNSGPSPEASFLGASSPMSTNIEDRRSTLNDDPSQPGRAVGSKSPDSDLQKAPRPWIPGVKSYAAGGAVPDDTGADPGDETPDTSEGIIPTTDAPGGEQQPEQVADASDQATGAPVILTPQQFTAAVSPDTVDKVNDHPSGFAGWVNDLLNKVGAAAAPGKPAAPGTPSTAGGQALQASGGLGGLLRSGVKAAGSAIGSMMTSGSTPPDQQAATDAQQPPTAPATPGAPQAFPVQRTAQQAPQPPQGAPGAQPTRLQQTGGEDENAAVQRLQQQALKIFPEYQQGAGTETMGPHHDALVAQRNAYVEKGLENLRANQNKIDVAQNAFGGKLSLQQDKDVNANARNAAANATRSSNTAMQVNGRAMNAQQANALRMLSVAASNPSADLNALAKQYAPLAAQLGLRPQDLLRQAQQQSQGGGAQGQQPAQMQEPKRFYNGKFYTKDEYNSMMQSGGPQ